MPNGELRFPVFETMLPRIRVDMAVVHVKTAALNGKRSKIKLQIFDTALRLVRPCCMQHVHPWYAVAFHSPPVELL